VRLLVFGNEGRVTKTLADQEFESGTHKIWQQNEGNAPGVYDLSMQNESVQQVKNIFVVR